MTDLHQAVPDPEALARLPESVARALTAIPLAIGADGTVDVAVAALDDGVVAKLSEAVGGRVRPVLADAHEVRRLLDSSYRVTGNVDRFVKAFEVSASKNPRGGQPLDSQESRQDDAPIVNIVSLILTQALRDRASDIHIEPQDDKVRVRFRIDGALHGVLELPTSMGPAVASRLKILASLNIVERRKPQDGQISTEIDGRIVDLRLSVLPTVWGEKTVIRVLDTNRSALPLDHLGMPATTFETFGNLIRSPFGMVLCAGPTGSGKTTTLYAALNEINESHRNITTIEDPVEYTFPSINQIQVNDRSGMSFATGLKSILRQDPDVILVGEIRDVETARIAVQSALTGHFVLSTLHGTDAVAALHRLLDMGVESFLIASSILAVVGQRLVRRICPSCTVPYEPTPEERAYYAAAGGGNPDRQFVRGEGCGYCAGTGYRDRVGVYELLRVTPELKRLIVGWATQEELRRLAMSQGMRSLQQEGIALVEQDVTTIAEVIRTIHAL